MNKLALVNKIKKAQEELFTELGYEGTLEELQQKIFTHAAKRNLMKQLGRSATQYEIEEFMQDPENQKHLINLDDLEYGITLVEGRPLSTDEQIFDDSDSTRGDFISRNIDEDTEHPHFSDEVEFRKYATKYCLQFLNQREKDIIGTYFGVGDNIMTKDELEEKYNLNTERIRQIKERAIMKLKLREERLWEELHIVKKIKNNTLLGVSPTSTDVSHIIPIEQLNGGGNKVHRAVAVSKDTAHQVSNTLQDNYTDNSSRGESAFNNSLYSTRNPYIELQDNDIIGIIDDKEEIFGVHFDPEKRKTLIGLIVIFQHALQKDPSVKRIVFSADLISKITNSKMRVQDTKTLKSLLHSFTRPYEYEIANGLSKNVALLVQVSDYRIENGPVKFDCTFAYEMIPALKKAPVSIQESTTDQTSNLAKNKLTTRSLPLPIDEMKKILFSLDIEGPILTAAYHFFIERTPMFEQHAKSKKLYEGMKQSMIHVMNLFYQITGKKLEMPDY